VRKLLWQPSEQRVKSANMTRFINFVNREYRGEIASYFQLYDWSIENIPDFWAAMWEFGEVKASRTYDAVVDDLGKFPGAKWFIGARLNFAENLLRYRDDRVALIFRGETRKSGKISYAELCNQVARLAKSLREIGLSPGDTVGAYMPNLMETAVAMLASTSIGAIWGSCGAELGAQAVLDRLGQIQPKALFTADGYWYKGKSSNTLLNAQKVAKEIPSIEKVIVTSYVGNKPDTSNIPNSVRFDEFLSPDERPEIRFEQLPFDHPVYIMFSSGTTGKPKCMVQGPGVFINHLKELILHTDLKRDDRITYITSPSWMM
jgi:acetoacetyl-CoA synthetase